MTLDPRRLDFLTELRERAGKSQEDMARHFGFTGSQSYKSVAAWEKGESKPQERRRDKFIGYLWDLLGLHKEPQQFEAYWELLCEVWYWRPLNMEERARLNLSPVANILPPSQPTTERISTAGGALIAGNVQAGGNIAGRDQYNYLLDLSQLQQLAKQFLEARDELNETDLSKQIAAYLQWVVERTQTIELRGVKMRDGGQTAYLKLEDVYVTLRAEIVGKRNGKIDLDHILNVGARLAIVGGPGSGKTTGLIYIAWVLAKAILENQPEWAAKKLGLHLNRENPTLPLPIYLPLSAYARQRFRNGTDHVAAGQTLPDFLPNYLNNTLSSINRLPAGFLGRLLASGQNVILLLDGLDEVADEGQRRLVREAIENLVTSRQQIRVVVTCRTVAFVGRSILARGFQQANVQPLDKTEVALLVQKAYECQYQDNESERELKTAELLTGIEKLEADHARRAQKEAQRLVNSPLMVRMLLVVHLSDRKLPQHRAELYKRFTESILYSDHAFDEEVAEDLRKLAGNSLELMRTVAFGMHRRGSKQGREIDDETLNAILKPAFASEIAAFVKLTRLRGTLLEERDGSYRFLHLAFQEYLAASYLIDDYAIDEGFAAKIRFFSDGEILNSWWREVALLIPGYLSMGKRRLADRFVRMLAGLDEWNSDASRWRIDVQLAASEIAASAALEWMPEEKDLLAALAQRVVELFHQPSFAQAQPLLRALAGRALAVLGDPRFDPNRWFLPSDNLLGFIEIPAGKFIIGEGNEQHELTLSTFYISRFPITVAQFRAAGIEPQAKDAFANPDNHPVCYISWYQAVEYCNWLDRTLRDSAQTPPALAEKLRQGWKITLPSEAEWEKAARGTKGQIYPWQGNGVEPNLANYDKTGIGSSSTVGCFPAGASPYGVEEMSGNVWEWTRILYLDYPYPSDEKGIQKRENLQKDDGKRRVLRGGAFYNSGSSVRCAYRINHNPDDGNYNVGFRVVASPFTSGL